MLSWGWETRHTKSQKPTASHVDLSLASFFPIHFLTGMKNPNQCNNDFVSVMMNVCVSVLMNVCVSVLMKVCVGGMMNVSVY